MEVREWGRRTHHLRHVNHRDKPARCIAIAAIREMAARFGEGKEKAAWFLKNHTYVSIQGDCYDWGLPGRRRRPEKGAGA